MDARILSDLNAEQQLPNPLTVSGENKMNQNLEQAQPSPAKIRALGGALIFIGILLVGGMGAIMWWMNNAVNNPSSTTKFTGTSDQKTVAFLILGAVTAFGCSSLIAGIYQFATGRRNKKLIWLMLGIWVVLVIMVWAVQVVFQP